MSKVRPKQIAVEGAVPGQLLGLVGTEWAPVDPPAGGGGGGGTGSGAFFDPFDRADTPLDGNNGWAKASNAAAGGDTVATFYIEGNLVKQTGFGGYPILHDRQSTVAGVADVQADVTILSASATGGICYAADASCAHGLAFLFDGTSGYWEIDRYAPDGRYSGSPSVFTDHGWTGWAVGTPMTIRCVYTEATHTLEVHQNGTLALTIDVSDTNGGFNFGTEVEALSAMTYGGFLSTYGDHTNNFENFSVDQSTGTGGGVVVAPVFDITDTPVATPDPGYAWLDPATGRAHVWTGSRYRFWDTSLVPEDTTGLPSLIGRYRATDLAYADGAAVAAWPDISGHGNNLITNTAGVMQAAGIAGKKSVAFVEYTSYDLPVATGHPGTVIAVFRNDDTTEGSIIASGPGGVAPYLGLLLGTGWRTSDGSGVLDIPVATPAAPHIYYTQFDTWVVNAGVDGSHTSSGSVMVGSIQRIGGYASAPSYSMHGLVAEILVYDAVLTTPQMDSIIEWLGYYWDIAVTV